MRTLPIRAGHDEVQQIDPGQHCNDDSVFHDIFRRVAAVFLHDQHEMMLIEHLRDFSKAGIDRNLREKFINMF
jgi:hypothetical protein